MEPIVYKPTIRGYNLKLATQRPSAWGNIPTILSELISQFNIKKNRAIEFGV